MAKEEKLLWDTQLALLAWALNASIWGGLTYLVEFWTGGPTWLPYLVIAAVFLFTTWAASRLSN